MTNATLRRKRRAQQPPAEAKAREELSKGFREKFERGGWVGPLPLGYESQLEIDGRGERIKGTGRAIFSSDIDTVRLILEIYATGNYSDLSLAEEMNAQGRTIIRKRKRPQKDSISEMLARKIRRHGDQAGGEFPAARGCSLRYLW